MEQYTLFLIIKNFYINIINIIIYLKLMDIKKINIKEIIKIVLISALISFVYVEINRNLWPILAIIVQFCLQIIALRLMADTKQNSIVTKNLISNAIAYIGFVINDNTFINLILMMIIETLLIFGFFKNKRFKRGFAFVKSKIDNDYIDIAMINISALVILAYSLFDNYYGDVTKQILFTFIVVGIIMI